MVQFRFDLQDHVLIYSPFVRSTCIFVNQVYVKNYIVGVFSLSERVY
jgi:hypothetical protein